MRAFIEANMESRSEWSFYPSAGQAKSYHVGKRCFSAPQPRPQPCPQPRPQPCPQPRPQPCPQPCPLERTLEDCLGRKKPVRVAWEPVPGSRPYLTPEYSPDFHKMGSTRIPPFHAADTFIPLQPPAVSPCKPYVEKRRVENREVEVMEVRSLDHWKPAPDMLKRFLQECDLVTLPWLDPSPLH
ncbi:spermatogenesis-associated serine-rich protein 1 [Osmerus eperlanus]|uniref:spermatogenesis-associated serine-rich protein 1 n=1 Tax=Osmerus eperlanus TaxID=29151 RepID=UPI002E10F434